MVTTISSSVLKLLENYLLAAEKENLVLKSIGKTLRKESMTPKPGGKFNGKSNGKSSRGKRKAATKLTRTKNGKGKKAMNAEQNREPKETATAPPRYFKFVQRMSKSTEKENKCSQKQCSNRRRITKNARN